MDEIKSLEIQLRSLPREAVPEELLGKLLADIPAAKNLRRAQRSHKYILPLFAAAAALVAAATISIFHPDAAHRDEHAISAHYVIFRPTLKQETDPCNIFPPLPEVRRVY
jgi:hypothetical protein